ncbi:alpha/beta hydrolase [Rufibacter quisquiliarum]|uniref:Proline iminopeptidase n=1 Tax=Rufibacter quisquiliarum TaxID=1549639 RepID=A0A839GUV0_9BACT|nr:alpha/beta hydrolase [Rufibacter quisquiliarum]MBA9078657.1 pimeloyl-ACP methyl ester carboxylesterase [Rufibacter quisquiliarum]
MKPTLILVLFLVFFSGRLAAQTKSIHEQKFIPIGGIEQWVTISGEDKTNPVILFLHGGPGSSMSQYDDAIYGYWKKDFVLVYWDQRGAGRTFGRNAPAKVTEDYWIENPLTVERMTADGIELSEYLVKHLGKRKITIIGTSWGSVLGASMALKRPDLFTAYIGHSQVVNGEAGFRRAFETVSRLAQAAKDQESISKLVALGPPPYDDARKSGQLMRIIKKYERENSTPAPVSWWKVRSEYDNEKDANDRYNGDDYSFLHYAGHKAMGIKSMEVGIDFMTNGFQYKIPVYFIQGEEDILTAKEVTKAYFDKVKAPEKEFVLVPGAAHGHNQAVIDAQYKAVRKALKR